MRKVVSPALVRSWLEARSLARELPAPVDEFDGFRVDTGSATETRRWVFSELQPGLVELGRAIRAPKHLIKLCGSPDELCASLPKRWHAHRSGYFMMRGAFQVPAQIPEGYLGETEKAASRTIARLLAPDGSVVASGYAAETDNAFIYDRIQTHHLHRRKGLGRALMSLLGATKTEPHRPELLVATEDGRKLYEVVGWTVVSPYSTASIPDPCE